MFITILRIFNIRTCEYCRKSFLPKKDIGYFDSQEYCSDQCCNIAVDSAIESHFGCSKETWYSTLKEVKEPEYYI